MSEEQIASREPAAAAWNCASLLTAEWLLLCMRAFMTLEMLEARKGPRAGGADVRLGLGRRVCSGSGIFRHLLSDYW